MGDQPISQIGMAEASHDRHIYRQDSNNESKESSSESGKPGPSGIKRLNNTDTSAGPKRIKTELKRKHSEDQSTYSPKRQKPDQSLNQRSTYAASGLKLNLHGTIYQLKLLMCFVKRAIDEKYPFHLATEMDDAEKFDDVVFEYQDQGKLTYRFLQAKHKQNPQCDKITVNDLKTEKDGDFSLQKYFVSFCKIIKNALFEEGDLKDFIIVTNTDFDFSITRKYRIDGQERKDSKERNVLNKKWENYFDIEKLTNDKILYFGKGEKTAKFKKNSFKDIENEIRSAINKNIQGIKRKQQVSGNTPQSLTNILDNNFTENINAFLEKLTFITNYPDETKLGDLIKEELGEKFHFLNVDLVSNSFEKDMLDFLKSYNKGKANFYSLEDGKSWFESLEEKINTLMTSGLSKVYPEVLRTYGIYFKNNLEALEGFLSSKSKQILHVSTPSIQLSSIKVLRSLEDSKLQNNHNYLKVEDGYIFVRLRTLLLEKIQKLVISTFSSKISQHLLVIDCETKNRENRGDIHKLFSVLREVLSKKIILIASSEDTLACKFSEFFQDKYEKVDDENSFKELKKDSKDYLLAKKVNFQGKDIVLNQLIDETSANDIIDLAIISRLIIKTGKKIEVGDNKSFFSIGYVPDYYIDRSLHRQRIKSEVLKTNMDAELFLITGANEEDLIEFENIHTWEQGKIYEKYKGIITLSSSQSAKQVFETLGEKQPENNIHWLEYQYGYPFWRASKGNLSALIDYIDENYVPTVKGIRDKKNGLREEYFNKSESLEQKVVIIANDPGVGKSTLLTSIARKMKKEKPYLWVVRINLHDYAEEGKESDLRKINFQENDVSEAIKFVTEMALPSDPKDMTIKLQQKLFKKGLENTDAQKPKIIILFDGFDEISPDCKHHTTKLIKALKGSNAIQLWVTTRVHEKADLEKELESPAYILNPLTLVEQKKFLSGFWKWRLKFSKDPDNHNIRENNYEDILIYLKEITSSGTYFSNKQKEAISNILEKYNLEQDLSPEQIKSLRGALDKLDFSKIGSKMLKDFMDFIGDAEKAFTNVPLHLQILSEVHFEKNFKNFKLRKDFGLYDVYNIFIKSKFEIFYRDKSKIRKGLPASNSIVARDSADLCEDHQNLALKFFLTKEDDKKRSVPSEFRKELENESNNTKQDLAMIGLLVSKGNQLEFVHQSFAEYFLSEYLIKNFEKEEVLKLFLEKFLIEKEHALLRKFFNDQLEKGKPLKHLLNLNLKKKIKKVITVAKESNKGQIDTVLHIVAEEGHSAVIKFLFDKLKGYKKTFDELKLATDNVGKTALHLAAEKGHTGTVEAFLGSVTNDKKSFRALVLATDNSGRTPLHLAALKDHTVTVQVLLDSVKYDKKNLKALVLATDNSRRTPLHLAAEKDHTETVKVLLDSVKDNKKNLEALVLATDNSRRTPLYLAAGKNHAKTVKALLDSVKKDKEILKALVLEADNWRNTALHKATEKNHTKTVKALLDSVKNDKGTLKLLVLATDNRRNTALHKAAEKDHIETVKALLDTVQNPKETLKYLVLATDNWRNTALHKAAEMDYTETVKTLLGSVKKDKKTFKELVLATDNWKKTAFELAACKNHTKTINALLDTVKDDKNILKVMLDILKRKLMINSIEDVELRTQAEAL